MDLDKSKELDSNKDINDIIGQHGPWQFGIFVIQFFLTMSCCWHVMAVVFQSPNLQHSCRTSNHSATDFHGIKQIYQCQDDDNQRCHSWTYDRSIYYSTIVSEWNLVCDRKWLTSLTKSIYVLGHLVAAIAFGQLSDRIGRRPVILMSYGIFWISAFATAYVDSIGLFILLRFLVALGLTAATTVCFVTLMEIMGRDMRSIYGLSSKFGWILGYLSLSAIAWKVRDWRNLQLVITLPLFPLVAMCWIVDESPRWLLATGQIDQAKVILIKASKRNRNSVDDVQLPLEKLCSRSLKDRSAENSQEGFLDILRYRSIRRSTLYLLYTWFSTSLVYYSLAWGTDELEGDPFWNFFLSGLVELPAKCLCILINKFYGRRLPLSNTSIVAGCSLTYYSFILTRDDMKCKIFWFMLAKFCLSISYSLLYIYSSEVFPTVIRGIGVGYCSGIARVGAMLAPFLAHLGGRDQPYLCYSIYGFLGISSGVGIMFLPETNKRKLPETFMEAELFHRNEDIINSNNSSHLSKA